MNKASTKMKRGGAAAQPADTLADLPPAGFLTPFGWQDSSPAVRAERLLLDSERNVRNAACALHAGMVGSPEERSAALSFLAVALRREADIIGRARTVLQDAAYRK